MDNLDNLRQKIKQFFADISGFSNAGKAATIIIAVLLVIAAYLFITRFAFWLILIAIVFVVIKLYFVEHTNQIWRADDARKAVKSVVDGISQKGFINRNEFKFGKQKMPSEVLRTFNRAIFEFELAKDEVSIDVFKNDNVLTYESQQSWMRYLRDNAERTAFLVDRVTLINRDSHYLLRIVFKSSKQCRILSRDDVYNSQFFDKDF